MVKRVAGADSEGMKDVLVVAITWIALVAGFLLSADAVPWLVSFPVLGFVWVFVPVAVARTARPVVGVVSLATFATVLGVFLVLVWITFALMAGIGTTVFGLDLSANRAVADLAIIGAAGVTGAVLGGLAGSRLVKAARAELDQLNG
ncbi:MAG: hypothetical protein KJO17_03935 [Acidimicrobiia bacterium]|nr:hypothetical protein [Acidimicrobiia bacterium]MBT8215982.1 hypothetical protein [Acidimicrobiia bacterium]NNL69366.1 hypothetical protein [Acidimicrobiia bacterium]